MKNKFIFVVMALCAIEAGAQIPTATIAVTGHVMFTSTWAQFNPVIAIDKTRAPNVLVSFTTTHYGDCEPTYDNYQAYYYSPSGGAACSTSCLGNSTELPTVGSSHPESHGFPSVCFDQNGQGYMMGLDGDATGFFALATSDDGGTWASGAPNTHIASTGDCINPMAIADDLSTSSYAGNYYVVWENLNTTSGSAVVHTATMTAGGSSFGSTITMGGSSSAYNQEGPTITTGPEYGGTNDGIVYICWSEDHIGTSGFQPTKLGSAYSIDGGSTYTTNSVFDYWGIGGGYSDDANYGGTYVNAWPSIAVDKSCGPHRGTLYMVAAEKIQNSSGTVLGSVISMWYSVDKGQHWGGGYVLPQSLTGYIYSGGGLAVSAPSGQDYCWFPSIAIDDLTGVISVVYYGYSGSASNTNTYVSYCDPADPTNPSNWHSVQVSTSSQTPEDYSQVSCNHYPCTLDHQNPNEGNSIAAYGGHAYPVWKDRSTGLRQIWIADIAYDAPQLASSATHLDDCPPFTTTAAYPYVIAGTQSFEAAEYIKLATCGSGYLSIGSSTQNANVTTTAGQYIEIGPGFSTYPGQVFLAQIETLTPCQTPGIIASKRNIPSVSITDTIDKNGIKVFAYPNPTDLITVGAFNSKFQNATFTVIDISGRQVGYYSNPNVSSNDVRQVIDVSSYSAGLYIVTMNADDTKYSFKFAKE